LLFAFCFLLLPFSKVNQVGLTCGSANPAAQQRRPTTRWGMIVVICATLRVSLHVLHGKSPSSAFSSGLKSQVSSFRFPLSAFRFQNLCPSVFICGKILPFLSFSRPGIFPGLKSQDFRFPLF
jgi:hypothetical protein